MIMIKSEKLDLYREMKLWINEIPDDCKEAEESDICIYKANKDIIWFDGTLCLELRIAPRAASNYAMLNFRFTKDDSGSCKVRYMQTKEERTVLSDLAAPGDIVNNGIVREYGDSLTQLFDELSMQDMLPSGTLEILGGRHGFIGSSMIAVTIVAKILISLFGLGENLEEADINAVILEGCKRKIK